MSGVSPKNASKYTAAKPMKGSPTIHMTWVVPAANEKEVDAFWNSHESWMRKTHTMGEASAKDDSKGPRLNEFFIAKGPELKNPLNPEEGKTGKIIYQMSEAYVDAAGIGKHMELAQESFKEGFDEMMKLNAQFGVHIDVGTLSIFTNLDDKVSNIKAGKGDPTIHITWRVPAKDEKEVDNFWKQHESWMRATHTMGADSAKDDSKGPRLTSFWIAKGKEMKNPLSPEEGETGAFIYRMSESYVDAAGIGKHMELAGNDGKDGSPSFIGGKGMAKLMEYNDKYLIQMDLSTAVFTNLLGDTNDSSYNSTAKFDVTPYDGKTYSLYHNGTCCSQLMFCLFTGGSYEFQYDLKVLDGGEQLDAHNFQVCGCLPMSPIPCCLFCGVGPCGFYGKHYRSKDPATPNLFIGKGGICQTPCCIMCMHHDNDYFVLDVEHDGSSPQKANYYIPGGKEGVTPGFGNPFTPPCLAGPCACCDNSDFMVNIEKGKGGPVKGKVAPQEMQR